MKKKSQTRSRRERGADQLRPVRFTRNYTEMTPGSVLVEMGRTIVLATASVEERVPRWMRKSGSGWVTAEYGMMPGSSNRRIRRDRYSGGRSKEISRLIGRSLRSVVNLPAMGETMVIVDCDVVQADGGTRTAAVNAAWIALHDAFAQAISDGVMTSDPMLDRVTAVSVGIVDGKCLLDLDYRDDSAASVDMNVVMTGRGLLVEVQATAEGQPYGRSELDRLLDLAGMGIERIGALQDLQVAE